MTKVIFIFCVAQTIVAGVSIFEIVSRILNNEKRKEKQKKRDEEEEKLNKLQKEVAIAEKNYWESKKQHDDIWFIKQMNEKD